MISKVAVAALVGLAAAAPVVERAITAGGPSDTQILNYALTLEHLENAFYQLGLKKFTQKQFSEAGLSASFYNNLQEISADEKSHVAFLSGALGQGNAVQPCTYNFGFNDVKTFLAIANVLEGVGVDAYLGAAQYISNPAYLTAAGSILTVESRHSAYLRDNQSPKLSPFPYAYDTPLDFDTVYSAAAGFITACPAGNAALLPALKAFPAISVAPAGVAKKGDTLTLTVAKCVDAKAAYFITGAGPVKADLTGSCKNYKVVVPQGATPGQEYIVLTNAVATPTDDNIVAGPAIVQVADNAYYFQQSQKPAGYGGKKAEEDCD